MHRIIFFDGVCNLCNTTVNFIMDQDSKKKFQFASLQSIFAQDFIRKSINISWFHTPKGLLLVNEELQKEFNSLNSILYFEDNIFYLKSDAAVRISMHLGGVYKIFSVSKFLPSSIRDTVYEYIASNRYTWFGRSKTCRLSTPESNKRFLG